MQHGGSYAMADSMPKTMIDELPPADAVSNRYIRETQNPRMMTGNVDQFESDDTVSNSRSTECTSRNR